MLGLCGEFERIAKVVLDKAERESQSRKKRKTAPEDTTQTQGNPPEQGKSARSPYSRRPGGARTTAPLSSPLFPNDVGDTARNEQSPFAPNQMPPSTSLPGDLPSNVNGMPGLGQDFQEILNQNNMGGIGGFPDQQLFTAGNTPMSSFQQPFVPQDLWQMPMTIEWDWADMSSNFPVFDTGMDSNGPPPPPPTE